MHRAKTKQQTLHGTLEGQIVKSEIEFRVKEVHRDLCEQDHHRRCKYTILLLSKTIKCLLSKNITYPFSQNITDLPSKSVTPLI